MTISGAIALTGLILLGLSGVFAIAAAEARWCSNVKLRWRIATALFLTSASAFIVAVWVEALR